MVEVQASAAKVDPPTRITNMTRIEELLADPRSDAGLPELRAELNELAKLRQNSRLAFCKRLALAYMLVVGRRYGSDAPKDGGTNKFTRWCDQNIKSATGQRYRVGTIVGYLAVGFAASPEKALVKANRAVVRIDARKRKLGAAIIRAMDKPEPPKPVPIARLRERFDINRDVATEVNQLMRAWEQACPEARRIFIQQVT